MYNSLENRGENYLGNSPQWQELNKSMAALVEEGEERTRAASAPPPQQPFTSFNLNRSPTPDPYSDIRCDEDYESFYQANAAQGRRLPPPLVYGQHFPNPQSLSLSQQRDYITAASRMSPNPNGLETITEQPTRPQSNMNGQSVNPQLLQALSAMSTHDRASPAPQPIADFQPPLQPLENGHASGNDASIMHQILAATGNLSLAGTPAPLAGTPLPPLSHTPPISHTPPSATPPPHPSLAVPPTQQNLAANVAAYAAAANLNSAPQPSGQEFVGNMEWHAVYQAAYQAALAHQQHFTQNMLLQQGQGHIAPQMAGQLYPQQASAAAQIASALAMNPGMMSNPSLLGSQNAGAAAAAAATLAMQQMMNSRQVNGHDHHDYERYSDREERRGRRGRRDRRDMDRDRDRDRDSPGSSAVRFTSLDEVKGQLMSVAKDQNGCRFLQRKFDEGGASAIAQVFPEILDNLTELMTDPFGNYLTQKLLDRCSEEQRLEVLRRASKQQALVKVALNTHGTRAVQKLIETLSSPEQVQLVIESLRPGVVDLIRDLNGNHVIQRCLQRLGPEESQFVYDAAQENTREIATHRHGCCVLQRCIDFATQEQREALVNKVLDNALSLSQDGFGNYCLQYVVDLEQTDVNIAVLKRLTGHFPELSQQKFSSNVVEKCLRIKDPKLQEMQYTVIKELMESPLLPRLLQDPYANFVIQTALAETKGPVHEELVNAIRPSLTSLRGTPFGKRILAKINVRL